jgi:Cof subfamily protein (haloacid dehalogenase superfamily)
MIKMIVSDMDGTLLNEDLSISNETLETIQKVREQGIIFTIATGRPDQLTKEYVEVLSLDSSFIMCNGSVIGHPFKKDRAYSKTIDKKVVLEIVEILEKENFMYMVYTKNAIYSKPNDRVELFLARNEELQYNQRSVWHTKYTKEDLVKDPVDKILLIEQNGKTMMDIKEKIKHIDSIDFVSSNVRFLDVIPKGISKGEAVLQLAKLYNIKQDEIVVFGDQKNDISMFEKIDYSVAMGNSSDDVKKHAKYTTKKNTENGVAWWINKHIL